MASWNTLRSYIKSNYTVGMDELDVLGLDFRFDDGRTQKVVVSRMTLGGSDWVEIATPICDERDIAPRDALATNGELVVGGLALRDGTIYFRHSLPLKDLDIDEFEVPFHLAVGFGDKLEREIVGTDRY